MTNYLEEIFDDMDCAIQSGDSWHDKGSIEKIKNYFKIWGKEVESVEKILEEA